MTYAEPTLNTIPTEPIGSIPRPLNLLQKLAKFDSEDPALAPLYEDAVRDTVERSEATGSPVVTDGEQRKYHNFLTYCMHGLPNMAPDGLKRYADSYLDLTMRYAHVPVKQAVQPGLNI